MKKLTDAAVKAALKRASDGRRDLPDGSVPGLSLRIGPDATTWSLVFRVAGEGGVTGRGHQKKGKRHRLTIGEYPIVSLEAARSFANTYLDQAKRGISPLAAMESAATSNGLTIAQLSEKFLTDYVRMKELRAEM